jgi:hypothetical protein
MLGLGPVVEVSTVQLESYLSEIKDKMSRYEVEVNLLPVIARKLDLCVLDVDVIRDKFYQQQPHPKVRVTIREGDSEKERERE